MARRCTVCASANRAEIEAALVAGRPVRETASVFTVSPSAITRHAAAHLSETLVRAAQAVASVQVDQQTDALDVMAELQRCFTRTNLVLDACDRWLRDPEDPTRYDVGPRSHDITVTYLEPDDQGKQHQRKAPLDVLLARLGEGGLTPVGYEVRHADPRELVLKAVAQLRPLAELLAKLRGQLDERPQVSIALAPEWLTVRTALLDALLPYPEARQAVTARLVALDVGGNGAGH